MKLIRPERRGIKRSEGRNVVAAAAYRSGSRLTIESYDKETGITSREVADYSHKQNVIYSEIIVPDYAPDWMRDREQLWNNVERIERYKNAELAYEMQVSFPNILSKESAINLVKEMCRDHYCRDGMIADASIHWEEGNHHAHILLTTRSIDGNQFHAKTNRSWRGPRWVRETRKDWEIVTNKYLALDGHDIRATVDSYKVRGLDIRPLISEPMAVTQMEAKGYSTNVRSLNKEIQAKNIAKLKANPEMVLRSLSLGKTVFTDTDIARELGNYCRGDDEVFDMLIREIMSSDALVVMGRRDLEGNVRYGYKPDVEMERTLFKEVRAIRDRKSTKCDEGKLDRQLLEVTRGKREGIILSEEQVNAIKHVVVDSGDIAAIDGKAGTGKSSMQKIIAEHYASLGYRVRGTALSGVASRSLGSDAGIESNTIARLSYLWKSDKERLTSNDILIVEEAGMVGTSEMAMLMSEVKSSGAKVILVGDNEQLQPITMGQAFRGIMEEVDAATVTQVFRQKEQWQRQATEYFSVGDVGSAIGLYEEHDCIRFEQSKEDSIERLTDDYVEDYVKERDVSRIVLAHTNKDVDQLNQRIRSKLKQTGSLSEAQLVATSSGNKEFCVGDRVLFTTNERYNLHVSNGTMGEVTKLSGSMIHVRLSGEDRVVAVNVDEYKDIVHGYAATIHKSQGVTVDQSYILASKGLNEHLSYVAGSRHRINTIIYAAEETFKDVDSLVRAFSRDSPKALVKDFDEENAEIVAKVRRYDETVIGCRKLLSEIREWALLEGEAVWKHDKWNAFKDLKEERQKHAKDMVDDYKIYKHLLRGELRYTKETLLAHAHGGKFVLSKEEQRIEAQAEVYASSHKQCEKMLASLRTEKGFHIKDHADYPAYVKAREMRNAQAYKLYVLRKMQAHVVDSTLAQNNIKVKQMSYAALQYEQGQVLEDKNINDLQAHYVSLELYKGHKKITDEQQHVSWLYHKVRSRREELKVIKEAIRVHESKIAKLRVKMDRQDAAIRRQRQYFSKTFGNSQAGDRLLYDLKHYGEGKVEQKLTKSGNSYGKKLSKDEAQDVLHRLKEHDHDHRIAKETWKLSKALHSNVGIGVIRQKALHLEKTLGVLKEEDIFKGLERTYQALEKDSGAESTAVLKDKARMEIPIEDINIKELVAEYDLVKSELYKQQFQVKRAEHDAAKIHDLQERGAEVADAKKQYEKEILSLLPDTLKDPEKVMKEIKEATNFVLEIFEGLELKGSKYPIKTKERKQAEANLKRIKEIMISHKALQKEHTEVRKQSSNLEAGRDDRAKLSKAYKAAEQKREEKRSHIIAYCKTCSPEKLQKELGKDKGKKIERMLEREGVKDRVMEHTKSRSRDLEIE